MHDDILLTMVSHNLSMFDMDSGARI